MYLIVDITPYTGFNLVCAEPDKAGTFFVDEKFYNRQTDQLLLSMKEFLAEHEWTFKNLRGLAISASRSFTTTRTAAVLVNTIGHIHNLPVAFVEEGDLVGAAHEKLRRMKNFTPIAPIYSREPNITMAKKAI